jgi:hypothetical protein
LVKKSIDLACEAWGVSLCRFGGRHLLRRGGNVAGISKGWLAMREGFKLAFRCS